MAKKGVAQYQSFAKRFRVRIDGATRDLLNEAALAGEGHAKQNMVVNNSIDTGFALNSIHAVLVDGQGVDAATSDLPDKNGDVVQRTSAGLPAMGDNTSAVGCDANYAIYIELRAPFLFPALDQVKQDFGGIVQVVRRKRGL